MDGTVRGTFDLNVTPAVRGVREYRREAAKADEQTRRLGASIDDAFGPGLPAKVKGVEKSVRDFGQQNTQTRTKVRQEWQGMRRDIEREAAGISAAVTGVRDEIRALGREKAKPRIDLGGVADAIAQVELLEKRLDALNRQRVTPRVAIGGGFSAGAGAGGGGAAVARAASSGGGGGGRRIAGVSVRTLGAGAAVALPAVQSLAGAATALAGSLSGAAIGAGAVGLAGGGALGAGLATLVPLAKLSTQGLKDVEKATDAYTKAVQANGRSSKEAAQAERALQTLRRQNPGLGRAYQQRSAFLAEYRQQSRPALRQVYGAEADVLQVGRRALPNITRNSAVAAGAARRSAVSQARFLANDRQQDDLGFFTRSFARELPTMERSLENVERTFLNVARAATPFFHDANVWAEHWTAGWRTSTSNIESTRRSIGGMVDETREWKDLTGAVFETVRDLFSAGRPSGDSMVVDLTRTFDRWDSWIKGHPEQVQGFFEDAASSTRKMASGIAGAVHWLNELSTALRPILDNFSDLVTLASKFGLIGTPGAGAALFGAYRGVRGGGAGGGAGGGMLGGLGGGAGVAVGAVGASALAGRATRAEVRAGRTAGGALLMGPATVGSAAVLARREAAAAERVLAQRTIGQRVAGGGRALAASRVGMGARGALAGAGRAYLPIAALLGAAQFASADGNVAERTQSALSSASLGLIRAPLSGAQRVDRERGRVGQFLSSSGVGRLPNTQAGAQRGIRGIDAEIARLQPKARATTSRAFGVELNGAAFGGRQSEEEAKNVKTRIRLLQEERDALKQTNAQMERAKRSRLDQSSIQRASQYGAGIAGAYGVYRQGGKGGKGAKSVVDAAGATVDQVKDRLSKIRDAGVETLGEAGLAWADALAKKNPQVRGQVDRLNDAIEARFKRMGQRVSIVNGNILTGSKKEWSGIGEAMADPMERARERMSDDMTAIQKQAIGSLTAMGFSSGDAKKLVGGMEAGGKSAARSNADISSGPTGAGQRQSVSDAGRPGAAAAGLKRARGGGVIAGGGLMDTVPVGNGMAAPGEAWIANRHTLHDLSRATVEKYGLTAQQLISGETRRHSMPHKFALGGFGGDAAKAAAQSGLKSQVPLAGVHPSVLRAASKIESKFPGLTITSGTGGTHATHSMHYLGEAVDIGGDSRTMLAAASWIKSNMGGSLAEGIHNPNLSIKGGKTVPSSFWGGAVWGEHLNHIHIGVTDGTSIGGGARGGGASGGGGSGGAGRISVRGPGIKQPGVPGLLRGRAGDLYAAGLQKKVNASLAKSGGGGSGGDLSGFSGGGTAGANQALGRRMMLAAGWGADQWPALKSLWTGESGWSNTARNASSGAFGIPQALPASKMGAAAVGGDAAAQIRWGLGYIRDRYKSPSGALSAWNSRSPHWYATGGKTEGVQWGGAFANGGSITTNGPTMLMAGEGHRRREKVTVTPAGAGGGDETPTQLHVHVHFDGGVTVASQEDANVLMRKAAHMAASEILKSIRKGTEGVVA